MREIDNCLRQVAKVREVAQQTEVAYVARSRLGRLVLALAQLVSRVANVPAADRPGRLWVPEAATVEIRNLVEACNNLTETARTLVQPSEPLDERWQRGWAEVTSELDRIELHLEEIRRQIPD